jgi:predicted lipid-binding transport protein (Tim44 family)
MRRRPAAALFAAFAVVALALAPAIVEARPGGSSSSGSRGSRTYSAPPATQTAPSGAQQMQRTQTPPSSPAQAAGAPAAARPAAAPQGSFFSRNPLMAGLMGGLLGAGLFGLLSGSGLFGGLSGLAGLFGLLLQVALIGGLVYLAIRLLRSRRQPALAAAGPAGYAREAQVQPRPGAMGMAGAAPVATRPVQVTEADFSAFAESLVAVNAAWSRQDLEALRRLSTPEMTNYFAQDLNDLRARGWTNTTSDVRLEQGDLAEAWNEDGQDYATVAMRFSLIDVTRAADGSVAEGHPTNRSTATELWTFIRRPGSPWMLSAIQQSG